MFPGKEFGVVVDYKGIATFLKEPTHKYTTGVGTGNPAYDIAEVIRIFNENLVLVRNYIPTGIKKEEMELYPCAYLHNYLNQGDRDPLTDPIYQYYIDQAPVFIKGQASDLREFIKRYIKFGDNKENLYKIENGRIRPSKSLQDALNQMLKGNEEFVMIDDQKVVYEEALLMAREAVRTNVKQVLVVKGGPGTGKSVLADNLLVELTQLGS